MHLLKKVRSGKPSTFHKQTNKWIMKRSRLRSKFWNTKCYIDEKTYNKQRNICVRVYSGKQRKNFFGNINVRDVKDNKNFWETVKSYLWAKLKPIQKLRLLKKKKEKKRKYPPRARHLTYRIWRGNIRALTQLKLLINCLWI